MITPELVGMPLVRVQQVLGPIEPEPLVGER